MDVVVWFKPDGTQMVMNLNDEVLTAMVRMWKKRRGIDPDDDGVTSDDDGGINPDDE